MQVSASPELLAAFDEHDRDVRLRYSKVVLALSIVLVPAGTSLDWFVYPHRLKEFLLVRLGVAGVAGIALALHYTAVRAAPHPLVRNVRAAADQRGDQLDDSALGRGSVTVLRGHEPGAPGDRRARSLELRGSGGGVQHDAGILLRRLRHPRQRARAAQYLLQQRLLLGPHQHHLRDFRLLQTQISVRGVPAELRAGALLSAT